MESQPEPERQRTPVQALSPQQERRIREYLDEKLLDISRNFRKRSEPTTQLPTLTSYLDATRKILSIILQIPPIDPSTSIRIAYLLKVTNDGLTSITGYLPNADDMPTLIDWLEDLDDSWVVVLRRQVWNPDEQQGIESTSAAGSTSSPITQTERTRLRSLLAAGEERLEEWLAGLSVVNGEEVDLEIILERMGVQNRFDDLFSGTLTELGDLHGVVIEPGDEAVVGPC